MRGTSLSSEKRHKAGPGWQDSSKTWGEKRIMAGSFGPDFGPRAEDDMPNVSATLTIELALLIAIVSPCSGDAGFAGLSHSRSISRNQTEFAAARTGERSASTRATLRAVDPVEEAEKTKTCAVENVIPGTSKEVRGFVE